MKIEFILIQLLPILNTNKILKKAIDCYLFQQINNTSDQCYSLKIFNDNQYAF